MSVPPIQTVKGRVVFFRMGREKISTLKPLTVWILPLPFRRRKRGIGFNNPALAPRPLPKNRMGRYAIGLEKA